MNLLESTRVKLRNFISRHEVMALRLFRGFICLMGLLSVRTCFYEGSVLDNRFLILVVTVVGGFVPFSATTLIIIFSALIHIASLSRQVAIALSLLLVFIYLLSFYYNSDDRFYAVLSPIFYQMRIPFAVPMAAGLFGKVNDVVPVMGGSIVGFYLRLVIENKALLKDPASNIDAFSLMLDQMVRNQLFYCYVAANIAMFLIVYFVRKKIVVHASEIGVSFGALASFVIMLTANLFFNSGENIAQFVVEIIVTWVLGLFVSYFFVEADYSRPETLQFEDDEYYYYVTAIPKIHITKEEWKVKRITGNDLGKDEEK